MVALLIACLWAYSSPSVAQLRRQSCHLVSPESNPLRRGATDPPDAAKVAMPPGMDTSRAIPTYSGCYKVGTGGFSLAYKVEDKVPYGTLEVVIWDEGTSFGSGLTTLCRGEGKLIWKV